MIADCVLDRGHHHYGSAGGEQDYALLFAVTYGKVRFVVAGTERIAEKSDFIYIPPRTPFAADSLPNVFHEKYVVVLKPGTAYPQLPLLSEATPRIAKPGRCEWMIDRLRIAHEEWLEQAPYADIRCQAIVLELAAVWSRELTREPTSPSSLLLAERMKAYIAGHYREKISKEDLAAAIGRSPNHAASLFKRTTGQTISEYAHGVRIKTAINLLKQSLLTAGEIAEYVGYRDLSYFHRVFKKLTGYAPVHFMNERENRQ